MTFELPGVVWVLLAWLLASVCIAAGLARWFRWLRDEYTGETPWESTPMDRDYEVRWKDGRVESRRRA